MLGSNRGRKQNENGSNSQPDCDWTLFSTTDVIPEEKDPSRPWLWTLPFDVTVRKARLRCEAIFRVPTEISYDGNSRFPM